MMYPINLVEDAALERMAKIACAMCGAKVMLVEVKHQISEGMHWMHHGLTGSNVCAYCWEDMHKIPE